MYKSIVEAENRWLQPVEAFNRELFQEHWMPAHDLAHHQRVWKHARWLFEVLPSNFSFPWELLLLACYFHDTGMIYDHGPGHGKKSRQVCESFLKLHPHLLTSDPEPALTAIELHDDKTYTTKVQHNPVYTLLCLADDWDAFGALGACRYIEIYWQRGLSAEQIPMAVLENAAMRYLNMKRQLSACSDVLNKVEVRYRILCSYFESSAYMETPVSLVEWMEEYVLRPKKDLFYATTPSLLMESISNSRIAALIREVGEEMGQ